MSVKVPHVAVRQQQHGAVTACQAAGASPGVEMEPDRKLILCVGRQRSAIDRKENVLAIEPVAIPGKRHKAFMDDSETFRISVVGRAQHHAPPLVISRYCHVAGTIKDWNAKHASDGGGIKKMTRRRVVERDS